MGDVKRAETNGRARTFGFDAHQLLQSGSGVASDDEDLYLRQVPRMDLYMMAGYMSVMC